MDGPYDLDAVMALPSGWAERVIAAPRVHAPGRVFAYDNGASYLLGVGLAERVGTSLGAFAEEALFAPLGMRDVRWLRGPDGHDVGCAHLRIRAQDLGVVGEL
ncbi:MAG TPA: serine hydrolase [Solirubrobacteraceae bacterium]|nr:serine hydrolase [Solirubrobacteraceae bacterium]